MAHGYGVFFGQKILKLCRLYRPPLDRWAQGDLPPPRVLSLHLARPPCYSLVWGSGRVLVNKQKRRSFLIWSDSKNWETDAVWDEPVETRWHHRTLSHLSPSNCLLSTLLWGLMEEGDHHGDRWANLALNSPLLWCSKPLCPAHGARKFAPCGVGGGGPSRPALLVPQ